MAKYKVTGQLKSGGQEVTLAEFDDEEPVQPGFARRLFDRYEHVRGDDDVIRLYVDGTVYLKSLGPKAWR